MARFGADRRGVWGRVGVPLGIGAIFAAPLVLALLVYGRPEWVPEERLEHGVLMTPARVQDPQAVLDRQGKRLADGRYLGRWTLLYTSPGSCARDCLMLMDLLKRVCRAQTRGPSRVQRVLAVRVLTEDTARVLKQVDPGLQVVLAPEPWVLPAGQVYLVDPLGNLVLRYPPGFSPQGLARDLGRLMGLSRVG